MNCPVCGREVTAGGAFCPQCGAKLPQLRVGGGIVPADAESADAAPAARDAAGAALGGGRGVADVPEVTLWEGAYSPKAMLGSIVGCGLASAVLLVGAAWLHLSGREGAPAAILLAVVLCFAVGARLATKRLGIRYRLTNQMFYHERGIVTRVTNRIEVIDIDDVMYTQGLLDQIVNTGRIKITSTDRTDPTFWVQGVENVRDVAHKIDQARRAERIRRGVSVEAV